MNSLKRKFIYAIGATALSMGISMTPVQATGWIEVTPINMSCADAEVLMGCSIVEMTDSLEVIADKDFGTSITEDGEPPIPMMCDGKEFCPGQNMEGFSASDDSGLEIIFTPFAISIEAVSVASVEEEGEIDVDVVIAAPKKRGVRSLEETSAEEDIVVTYTKANIAEVDVSTRARRRAYRSRVRFRGYSRRR